MRTRVILSLRVIIRLWAESKISLYNLCQVPQSFISFICFLCLQKVAKAIGRSLSHYIQSLHHECRKTLWVRVVPEVYRHPSPEWACPKSGTLACAWDALSSYFLRVAAEDRNSRKWQGITRPKYALLLFNQFFLFISSSVCWSYLQI